MNAIGFCGASARPESADKVDRYLDIPLKNRISVDPCILPRPAL